MNRGVKVGDKLPCLSCGGKGWKVERSFAGYDYPRLCKGCGGFGKQEIRP